MAMGGRQARERGCSSLGLFASPHWLSLRVPATASGCWPRSPRVNRVVGRDVSAPAGTFVRRDGPSVARISSHGLPSGGRPGEVERHVHDHVLLAADVPAPAELDQGIAGVQFMAVGDPVGVPEEDFVRVYPPSATRGRPAPAGPAVDGPDCPWPSRANRSDRCCQRGCSRPRSAIMALPPASWRRRGPCRCLGAGACTCGAGGRALAGSGGLSGLAGGAGSVGWSGDVVRSCRKGMGGTRTRGDRF